MKWSEPIRLKIPLRDVRVVNRAPAADSTQINAEREKAAYERGRLEGENALREQLIAQRNEMANLANNVLESVKKVIPQVVQATENALIELALESARKLVAGMPINAKALEAIVREALRQVEDTAQITVQLHPDDFALLQKHRSPVLQTPPGSEPLQFVSSSEVTQGGCLVRTRFGIIDARRETKLEQIREAIAA